MCAPLGTTGRWPAPWVTALHAPVPAAAPPGEPTQVRLPTLAGQAGLPPSSTSVYRLLGWPVLTNLLHLSRKAPFKRKCSWSQHLKSIFSKGKSLCWYWGVRMGTRQEGTFNFCFSENNLSLPSLCPAYLEMGGYWSYEKWYKAFSSCFREWG